MVGEVIVEGISVVGDLALGSISVGSRFPDDVQQVGDGLGVLGLLVEDVGDVGVIRGNGVDGSVGGGSFCC